MEFRLRLRVLRLAAGESASQLAAQFNKSEGAVRMWETGRSKPDVDTLIKLAKHFGVSTDYLLGLTDARHPENITLVDELGLSELAIFNINLLANKFLEERSTMERRTFLSILNSLLETDLFYDEYIGMVGDLTSASLPDEKTRRFLEFSLQEINQEIVNEIKERTLEQS